MNWDLGYIFLLLFIAIIGIIGAWAAIEAESRCRKLERKLKSYEEALKYKDIVLDACIVRAEEQQEKKKNQLRVRVLDGKLIGFMDKE